ncbi:hypothetical protein [Soonwooa sp.]|uniref:beta strand repeat-containing protein n=1 Tax=Soonwooa sp. TaxID=1938592 RepID=UPI00260F9B33|nr:hypothetical protein [Soonwooa sp.]
MIKIFIPIAFLCSVLFSAQVGINTATPDTTLDVRAINHLGTVSPADGILAPRVSSLSVNGTINGQLVYLIADAAPYFQGFHYWDGAKWIAVSVKAANSWLTTGNAGTTSANNFIGTTDSNPLRFRIYNTASGRIDLSNTFFGYSSETAGQNVNNSTVVGASSGYSINAPGATIIGAQNAVSALTGTSNTVIGYYSGRSLTSGTQNIILGESTGNYIVDGSNNVAIGNQALGSTTGSIGSNIAIGNQAGKAINGYNNILLGPSAGAESTGNNSILIGLSAGGQNGAGDNVMIGSNSGANAGNGTMNTYLGSNTGQYAKGSGNTALGYIALSASAGNTATQNNTVVGSYAATSSIGQSNVIVGRGAGQGSGGVNGSTGNQNTFLGTNAGTNYNSASNNVAIGYNAALTNYSGNNNINIGAFSDISDNLTNATAIGANSRVDQSNSLVLGSVVNVNYATSSTNVGIGTTKPNSALQVVGSVSMSIKIITANYTIADYDYQIVNKSTTPITITLPAASNANIGRIIKITNMNSTSNATLKTIIGGTFVLMGSSQVSSTANVNQFSTFQSDGINWYELEVS